MASRRLVWIRRLALGIVLVSCAEFVIATPGVQIHSMPPRTDFATFYLAGEMARDHQSPYDWPDLVRRGHALGFAHDQYPYLYLPPFAMAMQPFTRLPFVRARQVWMVVTTVVLMLAVVASAFLVQSQATALGIVQPVFSWILLAAFVPAALNSASVHSDIRLGSVGAWLWLAMAAAAWGLLRGRQVVVGAAIALATLVKLTPVVLVAWLWWRGARRAAAVAAGLLALSIVPAIVHWGPGILLDNWQNGLLPTLRAQIGWTINQSLDAYLLRLFDPSATVADPKDAVWMKTLLSSVLALVVVVATLRVLTQRPRSKALLPLELGYVLLAILILMKVTWVHTLATMLVVWPILLAVVVRAAEKGAPWAVRAGVLGSAGFFLSSAHIPVLWSEKLHHYPWILLTGVHLLGIVVLWATVGSVLRRSTPLAE